jgi:hypothetical protein
MKIICQLIVCLCSRPVVFVVKNAPVFESNFVFATLMPLANNQLNSSQQSDENAQCTSRAMKGTAFKNCDMAHTPSKRKLSPIHARKSSSDSLMDGTLFLNFSKYFCPFNPDLYYMHFPPCVSKVCSQVLCSLHFNAYSMENIICMCYCHILLQPVKSTSHSPMGPHGLLQG